LVFNLYLREEHKQELTYGIIDHGSKLTLPFLRFLPQAIKTFFFVTKPFLQSMSNSSVYSSVTTKEKESKDVSKLLMENKARLAENKARLAEKFKL
jgi:hypothetical protein